MNYRRGLLRVYAVIAFFWIAGTVVVMTMSTMRSLNDKEREAALKAAPPIPTSAEKPVDGWLHYEAGLSPDFPESARDVLRDNYYNQNVVPLVVRAGYGTESSREQFMKLTARPENINSQLKSALPIATIGILVPLIGYLFFFQVIPWIMLGFKSGTQIVR